MSAKAALKAAKTALDAGDYDTTIREAETALSADANNYFAKLFLGRAYEKLGKVGDAAASYLSAASLKPEDSQAWQGLCSLYETQGSKEVDGYRNASVKLAEIFASADDSHRCQTTVDKLVAFSKKHGSKAQYKRALEVILPNTTIYDFLEGRLQHPSITYARIAEITEDEEAQTIKQEIAARRTRVGARLGQVTSDVKREVFAKSPLEELYRQVIDWTSDDEVRREYEEKLVERGYETLTNLPLEQKGEKLDQFLTLVEGMVIIHHAFQLAWDLVLETRDLDDLQGLDVNILREYVQSYQDSGLAKILKGWLSSELSPFPPPPKEDKEEDDDDKPIGPEDRLLLMTDGLGICEQSPLAHRLVSDYYLHLEEHESAVDTARAGLKAISVESAKLGLSLQNTKDALNSVLATALVHHQAPRHHAEARRLFEDILARKPRWTPALIGLGLIFEENEEYDQAVEFLNRALEEHKYNINVGVELAWCKALNGDHTTAKAELENLFAKMKPDDPRARDLMAQTLYRIGICMWELDSSKAARKDRNGAYGKFLAAIKANVNYAPPYTSLGNYYLDYAKDKKRARQCFQKAFELSPSETYAAERLARTFAVQGDWQIVEVIAQRVIDTGRARPPPGSKRKGLSWPYSALGVVQMNKQEYQNAITSFLQALRISPDDYQSYVGLGESYQSSGRYNSALRTFTYALDPQDGMEMNVKGEKWFARFMLANVHRELGDYDEAIEGLQNVLIERPDEFGVLMSLIQTFVERLWRSIDTGLYGRAVESAIEALKVASAISKDHPDAFNMWKAVGDACLAFSWVQSSESDFPLEEVERLLQVEIEKTMFESLADVDQIGIQSLEVVEQNGHATILALSKALIAGILAYKRAIYSCSSDVHAQAVAWYNLGWAQHRAYVCVVSQSDPKAGKKYIQAGVRCFKRAIELESGNAEFWNALGVITTTLNPKVAQHSFVRSLHLNELNAKVWTNLGVLYLLQNDHELAHQAFGRAQSNDPDFAHAWVGEGLIALLLGDHREALSHFTHAFEISDSSSTISKRQYSMSVFDHLLSNPATSNDLTALIQPIFALEQLQRQSSNDLPYDHLSALFFERVGNHATAIEILTDLCTKAEAEYESSESLSSLARYAHAKADLARNLLAAQTFETAAENAETALDLSSDTESCGLDEAARTKLRLSAHLTAGLASHYLSKKNESIAMFKAALQESSNDPDVVASLVCVLWAHGGADEKSVAREQLFECVEKHPEHIGSVTLLGAIAAVDGDDDTVAAVADDLRTLRTSKAGLTLAEQTEIQSLLAALALLHPVSSASDGPDEALTQTQAAIMLAPDDTRAWSELADLEASDFAADMALEMGRKTVPPAGTMQAGSLAELFAGVGKVSAGQRAVVHAPWRRAGWNAMSAALGGGGD